MVFIKQIPNSVICFLLFFVFTHGAFANFCNTKCPKGRKDIYLHLISKDIADSWMYNGCFDSIELAKSKNKLPYHEEIIKNLGSIKEIIKKKESRCLAIKKLKLCAHGSPGVININSGFIFSNISSNINFLTANTIPTHLDEIGCIFSKISSIDLSTSDLLGECSGEDFIVLLAHSLIGKQGSHKITKRVLRVAKKTHLLSKNGYFADVEIDPIEITISSRGRKNRKISIHWGGYQRSSSTKCLENIKNLTTRVNEQFKYLTEKCAPQTIKGKQILAELAWCDQTLPEIYQKFEKKEFGKLRDKLSSKKGNPNLFEKNLLGFLSNKYNRTYGPCLYQYNISQNIKCGEITSSGSTYNLKKNKDMKKQIIKSRRKY